MLILIQFYNTTHYCAKALSFPSFLYIFFLQGARLSCNLLKWSLIIVLQAFRRFFKFFLPTLGALSLIPTKQHLSPTRDNLTTSLCSSSLPTSPSGNKLLQVPRSVKDGRVMLSSSYRTVLIWQTGPSSLQSVLFYINCYVENVTVSKTIWVFRTENLDKLQAL